MKNSTNTSERPIRVERPTVVIVGAGFGGLRAAQALEHVPVKVVLLDRHNYHLFQPLLYQVATAGLDPDQIAKPVRAIIRRQRNLEFRMAEALGVDMQGRRVMTRAGGLGYDYLILAVGAESNFYGLEGVARHSWALKDLEDGVAIRNHILSCFEWAMLEQDPERRRSLLSFVVVGGGPTGVEMSGALSELIRLVLVRDYPRLDFAEVRVFLVEAMSRLLPGFHEDLSRAAAQTLEAKGVRVQLEMVVEDYDGRRVDFKGGEVIHADTLIWAAGVRAAGLARGLAVPTAHLGRVAVERTLQVPGHPEVYVVGDAAYLEVEGRPLPMMAPVAVQMAETAAANIRRTLRGDSPEPFRYRDPGSLATIGRHAAVAQFRGLKFKGFPAWVVWLVVHLVNLIGFRNRLLVLINWAWDYLFYERAVRLITHEGASRPGASRGVALRSAGMATDGPEAVRQQEGEPEDAPEGLGRGGGGLAGGGRG